MAAGWARVAAEEAIQQIQMGAQSRLRADLAGSEVRGWSRHRYQTLLDTAHARSAGCRYARHAQAGPAEGHRPSARARGATVCFGTRGCIRAVLRLIVGDARGQTELVAQYRRGEEDLPAPSRPEPVWWEKSDASKG